MTTPTIEEMVETACIAHFEQERQESWAEFCIRLPNLAEVHREDMKRAILAVIERLSASAERDRREARSLALEEAANACETLTGSGATPTLRPGARMCLHRIRALKLKE